MNTERYSRQSFIGHGAQDTIESAIVGVVGLGGGGSHIVQQLAHIGFKHYVLFDGDTVDESNLNRLIGATLDDFRNHTPKIEIARRIILGLQPDADIQAYPSRWQEAAPVLQRCHLVFGCVDSFLAREELERFVRRYLIPYIDIGMDVIVGRDGKAVMGGQVIASIPGCPCMWCMGFLTDERIKREAEYYGAAGPRPQVVWPNGVLASTAVGLGVDLLTDWTENMRGSVYLEYDGNRGTIRPRKQQVVAEDCPHFSPDQVGDPVFREI